MTKHQRKRWEDEAIELVAKEVQWGEHHHTDPASPFYAALHKDKHHANLAGILGALGNTAHPRALSMVSDTHVVAFLNHQSHLVRESAIIALAPHPGPEVGRVAKQNS